MPQQSPGLQHFRFPTARHHRTWFMLCLFNRCLPLTMPAERSQRGDRRRCLRACETCKRRKERCDGRQPCRRCLARGVDSDCKIAHAPVMTDSLFPSPESDLGGRGNRWDNRPGSQQCARPFPQLPALAKDERGTYMYIGDAATLSFLHSARRIVHSVLARCDFVDDPLRQHGNEVHQRAGSSDGLIAQDGASPPPKPTPQDADYLIHWFNLATNCLLNIVDQQELARGLPDWCQRPQAEPEDSDSNLSAMYYLALALGAQSCPEDKDEIAERYFNHGRYITLMTFMEDPTLIMIQYHVLITMYLLAGSRRNSAFMHLGTAVRAAYALGLHKKDVSALYPPSEYSTRERFWRAIRILDLFMSASLGRPPSTTETRDTTAKDNYSASNDLCFIFENILTQIYAKRTISTEALAYITHLHRGWTSRFTEGLKTDGIPNSEHLETDRGSVPNIGLIQLKEAYYWTVMLLTQPILIEKVSLHASSSSSSPTATPSASTSNDILATACVDSAIRTSNLLASFISNPHIPKSLPLIANSAFLSALVLGLAVFSDMDQTLPLRRSLENARMVLAKFTPHDTTTKNHLAIVDSFKAACDRYVEIRAQRNMDCQSRLIGGIFGSLDADINVDINAGLPASDINPCNNHTHNYATHSTQRPHQNQDQVSPNSNLNSNETGAPNELNPLTLPTINSDSNPHFQRVTPFFHIPSPPGYMYSYRGTDMNGNSTLDLNTTIPPLSPKTLQPLFDCYGYDMEVEWPLSSAVDASA